MALHLCVVGHVAALPEQQLERHELDLPVRCTFCVVDDVAAMQQEPARDLRTCRDAVVANRDSTRWVALFNCGLEGKGSVQFHLSDQAKAVRAPYRQSQLQLQLQYD